MKSLIAQLGILLLIFTSCVKGCDKKNDTTATKDGSSDDRKIHLFIWGEYTSPELFKQFEAQTGIQVVESNFSSNEELLAKLQAGADGYDVIVPSDYMVSVMTQLNLLEELDRSKIPNFANIDPLLMKKQFDPNNKWSVPYSWAVTGIVFNKSKLKSPVLGYKDLFERDELKQRFSILDDNREAMNAVLKVAGQSANTVDDSALAAAKTSLMSVKTRIREFSSSPSSLLQQGDLLAAQMYSNEALRLAQKNKDFEFVLPSDGFTMAIDNMAIPKKSRKKLQAAALINFLLNPDVNLKFSTELLAAPVVLGVRERLPVAMKSHPALGQLEYIQQHGEMLHDLGEATKKYDRIWTEVKAASM